MQVCSVGCIGCMLCTKQCEYGCLLYTSTGYDSYCNAIKNDAQMLDEFVNYLTINVSEFYRNPALWKKPVSYTHLDYDTTVHFISEEELKKNHSGIPHGGFVIRTGKTGWNKENNHVIEYSLKLDSNPEFTSCVIVAYARAAYRLYKEGQSGCKTVFDIAPAYLSAKDGAELRKSLL